MSGWIHILALRQDVLIPIVDSKNYHPLIQILVRLILDWKSAGIILIPIFDGKPLKAKEPTRLGRDKKRKEAIEEYTAALAEKKGIRLIELYQSHDILKLARKTCD